MGALENCVREDLNQIAPRAMAVLNPLKVVFLNHPQGEMEMLPAMNHPNNPELGVREIPFGREIFIERDDFMEDPPRKFFRLRPGGEVRLRYAYIIKCVDVIKNDAGEILEVHCTYDPDTKSGRPGADRKVKGTIHWVSADESVTVEVRLFDRMFTLANPDANHEGKTVADFLNPDSLNVVSEARVEPALVGMEPGTHVQFERLGYFLIDTKDSQPGQPVFNRVVTLRDSWAKIE